MKALIPLLLQVSVGSTVLAWPAAGAPAAGAPAAVLAGASSWEPCKGSANTIWYRLTRDENRNASDGNYYFDIELENRGPYAGRLNYEVRSVRRSVLTDGSHHFAKGERWEFRFRGTSDASDPVYLTAKAWTHDR